MAPKPSVKTETFDMDSFFDFNQGTSQTSPATANSAAPSQLDPMSAFDKQDEHHQFSGPSYDYDLYKQQVGLPVGSMVSIPPRNVFDGYDSGVSDLGMDSMNGWSTGIDLDPDVTMEFNNPNSAMPAMFYPTASLNELPVNNFINPNTIAAHDDPPSNVGRLWPGMHSKQAHELAMQKAAATQAMQQRQIKMQNQQAQYRQPSNASQHVPSQPAQPKRSSTVAEPHVEESISRLLSQMRRNGAVDDDDGSPDDSNSALARLKKDDEDMDDDERLLASEEGKKLSSKERRQLRNKVSARAFRSRRKEYISQLEGEVALKSQEANTLRSENSTLMQENERYRGLIETLLRHPAFTPFINDISKDPSALGMPAPQQRLPSQQVPASTPVQQQQQQQQQPPQRPTSSQPQTQNSQTRPEYLDFDASQIEIPGQQQNDHQVGLAMIPENDFSKIKLHGAANDADFNNFMSVNAYAVTDLPSGPDPIDLLDASSVSLPRSCSPSSRRGAPSTPTAELVTLSNSELFTLLAKLDGAAQSLGH